MSLTYLSQWSHDNILTLFFDPKSFQKSFITLWQTLMYLHVQRVSRTQPLTFPAWCAEQDTVTQTNWTARNWDLTDFHFFLFILHFVSFFSALHMHSGFLCPVAAAALCKVGSLRISNQPNLKTKSMISQRLLLFIPHPGCSCHQGRGRTLCDAWHFLCI